MNATVHRTLMFIGALGAGAGAILATPGYEPLGIPVVAGVVCTLVSALTIMAATAYRANFPNEI